MNTVILIADKTRGEVVHQFAALRLGEPSRVQPQPQAVQFRLGPLARRIDAELVPSARSYEPAWSRSSTGPGMTTKSRDASMLLSAFHTTPRTS